MGIFEHVRRESLIKQMGDYRAYPYSTFTSRSAPASIRLLSTSIPRGIFQQAAIQARA